jgi:hypothetical protein
VIWINTSIMSSRLGGDTNVSSCRGISSKSDLVGTLWNGVDNLTNYGYNGSA